MDSRQHATGTFEVLYTDKKRCIEGLNLARQMFGSVDTTREAYTTMESSLAYMFIFCPEELYSTVESTLREASQRRIFFERRWGNS